MCLFNLRCLTQKGETPEYWHSFMISFREVSSSRSAPCRLGTRSLTYL